MNTRYQRSHEEETGKFTLYSQTCDNSNKNKGLLATSLLVFSAKDFSSLINNMITFRIIFSHRWLFGSSEAHKIGGWDSKKVSDAMKTGVWVQATFCI